MHCSRSMPLSREYSWLVISRHGNCSDHKLEYAHINMSNIGSHHKKTFKTRTYIVSRPVNKGIHADRVSAIQESLLMAYACMIRMYTGVATIYKLCGLVKPDTGHICPA